MFLRTCTYLSGTTCCCISVLRNSRLVLVKSTFSYEFYGTKLHYYIPFVIVQKVSNQNSSNRKQQKTEHLMGSKNFSQCSFEPVKITYTNLVL